jgi:cysteine synthase A
MVDRVERVTSGEAIEHGRRLAREEGILSGVSSGAAIAAALRLAKRKEFEGKMIVAILPDAAFLMKPVLQARI